jgi:hypothetical protein
MRKSSVTCLPLAATVGVVGREHMTYNDLQVGWELLEQHRFYHAMRDIDVNTITREELGRRMREFDKSKFGYKDPEPVQYVREEEVPQL